MPSIVTDTTTRTKDLTSSGWTTLDDPSSTYAVTPEDVEIRVNVDFFALSGDDGDAARWALSYNYKRVGGGNLDPVGTVASLLNGLSSGKQGDLGAALWDARVQHSGTDLSFQVKAEDGVAAGARIEVIYLVP